MALLTEIWDKRGAWASNAKATVESSDFIRKSGGLLDIADTQPAEMIVLIEQADAQVSRAVLPTTEIRRERLLHSLKHAKKNLVVRPVMDARNLPLPERNKPLAVLCAQVPIQLGRWRRCGTQHRHIF